MRAVFGDAGGVLVLDLVGEFFGKKALRLADRLLNSDVVLLAHGYLFSCPSLYRGKEHIAC